NIRWARRRTGKCKPTLNPHLAAINEYWSPHFRLPQVLLRRTGARRARLRPVDPRRRRAGRRGRRALRRVLPELRRRGRRPGARRDARDGPGHVDALLLAELHASRSRRAAAPG